ncbi:MAG: hypothetical protein M1817_003427 [Caeruleum heppii]|nr:MAG: hypothetical protein M1817_003427 [Caeruleum heppii]
MRSLSTLVLLALSFTSALAAPQRLTRSKGRSFLVRRVVNPNYKPSGAQAVKDAYSKFGWDMPGSAADSISIKNTATSDDVVEEDNVGSLAATSDTQNGVAQFLCPVVVGGQTLNMNIDTGSSDFWVFSPNLPSEQSAGHAIYDPAKSTTSTPSEGSTFKLTYGDGSAVRGDVGFDSVNIGGASVERQAIGLATNVSSSFTTTVNSDGLVGLAFSHINAIRPTQQKTFFDNLMDSLEEPVFTADLHHQGPSSYEFGTIDDTKFKGPLTYLPVDSSKGFWQLSSTSVQIGDKKMVSAAGMPSIVDTGTSILLMHDTAVQAYYDSVEGARFDAVEKGFVYPCSSTLPDFGIGIGDFTATIPGSLMNFFNLGGGKCFGALQSNNGNDVQILGDTFFNAHFVVFDGGQTRIGMAEQKVPDTSSI